MLIGCTYMLYVSFIYDDCHSKFLLADVICRLTVAHMFKCQNYIYIAIRWPIRSNILYYNLYVALRWPINQNFIYYITVAHK